MEDYKTEIVIPLKGTVKYKPEGSGELETAKELVIKAPNNKVLTQLSKLEQGYARANNDQQAKLISTGVMDNEKMLEAMKEIANSKDADEEEQATPDEVLDLIKSSGVNFDEYMLIFKDILLRSATLDGNTKLTTPLFEEMDARDTQVALGEYLVNFTNISSTKE